MAPIIKKNTSSSAGMKSGLLGKSSSGKSGGVFGGKSTSSLGKSSGKSVLLDKSSSKSSNSAGKNPFTNSNISSAKVQGKSPLIGYNSKVSNKTENVGTDHHSKNYNTNKISSGIYGSNTPTLPMPKNSGSVKLNNAFGVSGKSTKVLPSSSFENYSSSYSAQNPKKPSTTFGIIWIPTKKNKKKNIVYNSYKDDHKLRPKEKSPSMYHYMPGNMFAEEGDKKNESELLMPHTLVPFKADESGEKKSDKQGEHTAPTKEEEYQQFIGEKGDSKDAHGDSNDYKDRDSDDDYLENNDTTRSKSPESKCDDMKKGDNVDSVCLRPSRNPKARSMASPNTDEDDCGIKCLYYTLQCCDCVLM